MKRARHTEKIYVLAPNPNLYGTMACPKCGKAVDGNKHDYRLSTRWKNGDWGYCTIHRKCLQEEEHKWLQIEKENKKLDRRICNMRDKFAALKAEDRFAYDLVVDELFFD